MPFISFWFITGNHVGWYQAVGVAVCNCHSFCSEGLPGERFLAYVWYLGLVLDLALASESSKPCWQAQYILITHLAQHHLVNSAAQHVPCCPLPFCLVQHLSQYCGHPWGGLGSCETQMLSSSMSFSKSSIWVFGWPFIWLMLAVMVAAEGLCGWHRMSLLFYFVLLNVRIFPFHSSLIDMPLSLYLCGDSIKFPLPSHIHICCLYHKHSWKKKKRAMWYVLCCYDGNTWVPGVRLLFSIHLTWDRVKVSLGRYWQSNEE